MAEYEITLITRQALADLFNASEIKWAGRLEEPDFLSRLYDLAQIPSTDRRADDAAGDIHIHRVTWQDWPNDWIFHDPRFDLLHASDEVLLRFLCETLHPEVRPDAADANKLVVEYNRELAGDDYALVAVNHISRRPVYGPQKSRGRVHVFDELTGWQTVDRQMREVRSRLSVAETEEQCQAVGLLCREALISLAQEVYDPLLHPALDDVVVSKTDAKRMLEAVVAALLQGGTNEHIRGIAKNTVHLAVALQHKRTADFKTAALCAEATASTINIFAILTGYRIPRGPS